MKSESTTTQSLLREATQKKISYLLSKHAIKDVDVYVIIKEFFKEFLNAHYEFTFDELAQELKQTYIEKHIKEALYHLLEDFSTIEYKDEEIPQEVLREVLSTFSKLVDDLIKQQKEKKASLFGKLFGKKEAPLPDRPHPEEGKKEEPAAAPAEQPPTDFKEEKKEGLPKEKPSMEDVDVPAPHKKDDSTVEDGFQVPSISQEPTVSPPTDFDEASQGRAPVGAQGDDQMDAFPIDEGKQEEAISQSTGWTETSEPVQVEEKEDEPFPFASENEDLQRARRKHVNPADEDAMLQQAKPVEVKEEAAPVAQQAQSEKPKQAPPAARQPTRQEPVQAAPVAEDAPSPVQEQAAPPQGRPQAQAFPAAQQPAQKPRTDVYFGSEEEELSDDLNKLAEELDEIIRDEDLKLRPGAVMPADDIDQLITETERLVVEKQFGEAQDSYKELVGRYHELPEEDKHKYYDKVQRLYELLQQQ